jgi:ABC-type polysaccharide/polyol phosphate export permease
LAGRFDPMAVVVDVVRGLAMGRVWRAFAWDETQQRYRRSVLGIAWIIVSYLVFVAGLAIFFGGFANVDTRHFLIYVALGYAAFQFIVGNIIDGCSVFITSAHWIKSTPLPYSIYVYKSIFRSLFPFALHMICALTIMTLNGWRPTAAAFLAIPAFALYLLNAIWLQYLLGLLSARWRDITHLMGAVTKVLFIMSPVMWVYHEGTGLVRRIADANPMTHFIEILRGPLMNEPLSAFSWKFALLSTAIGIACTILAGAVMRRRLPFWV